MCRRWDRKRWGPGARGAGRGRGRCSPAAPFHIQDLEYADRAGDGRGPRTPGSSNAMTSVKYPARTGGRRPGCRTRRWRAHPALGGVVLPGAALRVGAEAMQTRLSRLGYGNAWDTPAGRQLLARRQFADFPREQVALLARLARGEVPFSPEHVATLRRIMVLTVARAGRFRARPGSVNWAWAGSGAGSGAGSRLVRGLAERATGPSPSPPTCTAAT